MLNWFTVKCPLSTREKVWVEQRMLWLAERFGIARMQNARVILPTEEFFPDSYSGDEPSARKYLDRICGYMGIDPRSIELKIVADRDIPGAAGLYEMRDRSNIYVAASQLATPLHLMSTLAHELAHELLLKGNHLTQAVPDHELVTDLVPVYLGVGIFTANSTVQSSTKRLGNLSWWSISKQGYLSSVTLGYAAALFAFARGEDRPPWAKELRADSAVTLRSALRYLQKTGDSLFTPSSISAPPKRPSLAELAEQLENRSATFRLAALLQVHEHPPASDLIESVERCMKDVDQDVREAAATALGRFGNAASAAVPLLIEACWHGTAENRLAATIALGKIRSSPLKVVPALVLALKDESEPVICAAACSLKEFGRDAESAEPQLMSSIEAAAYSNAASLDSLTAALGAISPDALTRLRDHFQSHDPEARRLALSSFESQKQQTLD